MSLYGDNKYNTTDLGNLHKNKPEMGWSFTKPVRGWGVGGCNNLKNIYISNVIKFRTASPNFLSKPYVKGITHSRTLGGGITLIVDYVNLISRTYKVSKNTVPTREAFIVKRKK